MRIKENLFENFPSAFNRAVLNKALAEFTSI